MQKLCCVRTRQHPLPVWSHKFVLSSTTHISTNSHPFLVGIVSKIDLSDGFYRVHLRAEDIPTLGVAFPVGPGEEPLVALPLTLPMGWTESPPYFCSATKTLVDLINLHAFPSWDPPRHPLEPAAGTQPPMDGRHRISAPTPTFLPPPQLLVLPQLPPPQQRHHRRPLAYGDVFVDDEILLAQGTPNQLQRFKRQALHLNNQIFRANDHHDNPTVRKEPISESKLLKGDACWSTTKVILGWTLDTLRGTIELPAHRKTRLWDILTDALHRKRVSVRAWQKLLGELRSMVLGIPGGQGLFSQLQVALQHKAHHRVRIHKEARVCLQDLYALAQDLAQRPTRMAEIVPTHPLYAGCCDAALAGMGGVWLPLWTRTIHSIHHTSGGLHSHRRYNGSWSQQPTHRAPSPTQTLNLQGPLHMQTPPGHPGMHSGHLL